ncbi:hypothetical protein PFICI_10885 [Pestalotiopsis fici W106-1]|uniref:CCHC-type domain-containing protein n=1 Tax=Pestalotiopsis fici (strain W106-1 / CGMCC3.15140) TaxID=1229662 RepID=W3WVY0_PESFW|nr:uncharacterized protein PFICI_10885 [Pestalotiopsis fici W106-1]ETS77011.1 hypothetical protein PFICI_10885 [Pestalotiopsis fici W106-1]
MSASTFNAPITTPSKMSWSDIVEMEYEEMSSSNIPTTTTSGAPSVSTESTTPSLKEANSTVNTPSKPSWSDIVQKEDKKVSTPSPASTTAVSNTPSMSTTPALKEAAQGLAHDLSVCPCAKDQVFQSSSSSSSSRRRGANTVIGNAAGVSYRYCNECNVYGHAQRDCAVRAARITKERADYAAYKARRAAYEARLAATDCRRCGELGHLARDCTATVAAPPPAQNVGKSNSQRKQKGGKNNSNKGDVLVGANGKRYQLQQGGIVAPVRGRRA